MMGHSHTISEISNLQTTLDGKASSSHNHDSSYAAINHTHNDYASSSHNHDSSYASINHTHTMSDITDLANITVSIDSAVSIDTADNGEATHLLTKEEMPVHNHGVWWRGYRTIPDGSGPRHATARDYISDDPYQTFKCDNAGGKDGTQAHNNMPPYITVYCWRRTA